MNFHVLIIGGGVAGLQCALILGSAEKKPFAMGKKIVIDPALASGAFVTTVTDVVGFFAFLGLAAWMLL